MPANAKQRYFCSVPFRKLALAPRGEAHLCCALWMRRPVGDWRELDENGNIIDAIWNSRAARAIREDIIAGKFSYCNEQCPYLKTKTAPVVPYEDALNDEELRPLILGTAETTKYPEEIVCSYDESCNLQCSSCRSEPITSPLLECTHVQKEVMRVTPHIRRLVVTGSGDPFFSKAFWELLTSLQSLPSTVEIHLVTNGLLFTEQRWKKLRGVHSNIRSVNVSVDGASKETYLENRGASWDRLLSRLKFIGSLNLHRFSLSMVVQQNNFKEIPELLKVAKEVGAHFVNFQHLTNWGTYEAGDYARRAVHLREHPEHESLMKTMQSIGIENFHTYISTGN